MRVKTVAGVPHERHGGSGSSLMQVLAFTATTASPCRMGFLILPPECAHLRRLFTINAI
jgi:hypothetical protein